MTHFTIDVPLVDYREPPDGFPMTFGAVYANKLRNERIRADVIDRAKQERQEFDAKTPEQWLVYGKPTKPDAQWID